MAVKIKFDGGGNPEIPTLLLGKRSGKIIGQIRAENIHFSAQMNGSNELSFSTHKWYNGAKNPFWDELRDFRLIYVPEYDMWFELYVQLNEDDDCTKDMTCMQLGYAELSQINVSLTANTEDDIDMAERLKAEGIGESYQPKKIYDIGNPDNSLLDMILKDKARHYSIMYVDPQIANLQRTFNFKDKSIWDCFIEIGEEIRCYFDIVTGRTDEYDITREIYVYDLNTTCNSCGYRGDFHNVCPECGSDDLHEPAGKDTTIFISADELGDNIVFDTDEGSVKNCFKLVGGDDLMTATIRNLNPNGSDYLWYFPEYIKQDMSEGLQARLNSYNEQYDYWQNRAIITLDKSMVDSYNTLVEKYTREINDTKTRLVNYSQGGTVDLIDRPKVSSLLLTSIGWTGITTTQRAMYIKTYPSADSTKYGNFTPIVYDKEKYDIYVLSPSDMQQYAQDVMSGAKVDNLKLQVGPLYTGSNARVQAETNAVTIDALCETYYFGNNPDADIEPIPIVDGQVKVVGYKGLMLVYYNTVDFDGYLRHTMMPSVKINDTTAVIQMNNLVGGMSSVVVEDNINISSAQLAAESYARVIVDQRYKIRMFDGSIPESYKDGYYYRDGCPLTVKCTIESYSDSEDIYTNTLTVTIRDSSISTAMKEQYIKEKTDKALAKLKTEDYDITGLFAKNNSAFASELAKYALVPLQTFLGCATTLEDVLSDQGILDNTLGESWVPTVRRDLYSNSTNGLQGKIRALNSEIALRTRELNLISNTYQYNADGSIATKISAEDGYAYPVVIIKGMQGIVEDKQREIKDSLSFKKYIGDDYWPELSSFRREQTYTNNSFISDGLSNAEMFSRAQDYLKMARGEIFKSAELQHTISASLKDLLVIEKFEPLREYFELSNWLRVRVDDEVYRLRLIKYDIAYADLSTISVDFSDVIKTQDGLSDQQSIIKQAASVSSSYAYTQRQSSKGVKSYDIMSGWSTYGLNVTNQRIVAAANNQEQTWDEHGMLFKKYEDELGDYNLEQAKMLNSSLVFTTDGWESVQTAVGKFYYYDPSDSNKLKQGYGVNGQVIVGRLIFGEQLGIYNSTNTMTFDANGLSVQSTDGKNGLVINPNSDSFFSLNNKKFYINSDGSFGNSDGNFSVSSLGYMSCSGATINGKITNGSLTINSNGSISTSGGRFSVSSTGYMSCSGATINGKITNSKLTIDTDGSINSNNGKFKVDSSGNLYASGKISNGALTITQDGKITSSKFSLDALGALAYEGGKFEVSKDGVLTCQGAKLNGDFTVENSAKTRYFKAYSSSGLIEWKMENSSMSSSGYFKANGAEIQGTLKTGYSTGYNLYMNTSGEIRGYYQSSQRGLINFAGSSKWMPTGETIYGIQMTTDVLRISARLIAVSGSSEQSATATTGWTGKVPLVYRVAIIDDYGTIRWRYQKMYMQFINGIMVSDLSVWSDYSYDSDRSWVIPPQ